MDRTDTDHAGLLLADGRWP